MRILRTGVPVAVAGLATLLVTAAPGTAAGYNIVSVTGMDSSAHLVYICDPATDVVTIRVGVYPQPNTTDAVAPRAPQATGSQSGAVCDGTPQTATVSVGGAPLPAERWVRVRVALVTGAGVTAVKQTRKVLMP
ncbi:hypothetical protein EBN03_02975 [Nocardia stercoris]|uniref:Secreted protein n=2 Tax=Nocardia stercoris TaxID=2483361 RepID=A0A3M2LH05_9NOCA|nr:hypothetical protein EBN03_02975 [Nocardia stercoris]